MDILSPAGQETVNQEQRAIDIWSHANPDWHYVQTPKDTFAVCDALLVKDGIVRAVVETKCRRITYERFVETNHAMILTYNKLTKCRAVAELLHVPFLAFLYLVNDDILLWKSIWTPEDDWTTRMTIARTNAQISVNGGATTRQNVFINFSDAAMRRGTDGSK